jgi:hypothetical protein
MESDISDTEARLALHSIAHRRQQVIAEIDLPPWYWAGVAAGWVALGVLAAYGPAWATIAGTLAFAPRILSGRHASPLLSVRKDMVSRHVPTMVLAFLVVMTVVTVAFALIAHADGARHPALFASVVVAALVLLGGPNLMAFMRRRAEHRLGAS